MILDEEAIELIVLSAFPHRPDDDEVHEWMDVSDLLIRIAQRGDSVKFDERSFANRIADAVTRQINLGRLEAERMTSVWGDRFRLTWDGESQLTDLIDRSTDVPNDLLIPASDRLVSLDHNSAPYREVAEGIVQLSEEIRGANALDLAEDERSRIVAALQAASLLWDAGQLKLIQIKVGIIMAIEDAAAVLVPLGKAVGAGLIVEVIKHLVKNITGIEL